VKKELNKSMFYIKVMVKVKIKLTLCMPWRHVREWRDMALFICNLSTRSTWVVSFKPQSLTPGERSPVHNGQEVG